MAQGISRNIKNSLWNLGNISLYPLIFLGLTPLLIDRLGEHVFGTWIILNSIAFVSVQVLHFGIGPSLTNYVAESRGRKDPKRLNRYFNSALNFTGLLFIGVMILGIAISMFLPESFFEWGGLNDPSLLSRAFTLMVFLIGAKLFEQVFIGFFKGYEEFDTLTYFTLTHKLINLGVQLVFVLLGKGLDYLIATALVSSSLLVVVQYLWCLRYLEHYSWRAEIDKLIFGRMSEFGFWSWMQTIIAMLSFQLDRFIVAAYLGMDVVAYYSLASMIANHLHMALEALVAWLFPAVSRIINQGRDAIPLYISSLGILLTISLVGLGGLYFVREPLFQLWLGAEKYSYIIEFLELFILFEVFYVISIAPKFFLNGLAKLKLITGIEVIYKSFVILSMLGAFYFFGTGKSLIWGQICAMGIAMPIVLMVVNKSVTKGNWFRDGLVFAIPNFIMFTVIVSNSLAYQVIGTLLTFGSIYLVYLRHKSMNFKLITE